MTIIEILTQILIRITDQLHDKMADPTKCLPLTPDSIRLAHELIHPYIHQTPLLTSKSLNKIASQPQVPGGSSPKLNLFFKCENQQRIGAFKARGAHHAILRLIESIGLEEVRKRGVVTHSSGETWWRA